MKKNENERKPEYDCRSDQLTDDRRAGGSYGRI